MKRPQLALLAITLVMAGLALWLAANEPRQREQPTIRIEPTVEVQPPSPQPSQQAGSTGPPPQAGAALWTFDGTPDGPLAFKDHADYADFDVQVHSRNQPSWGDNALPPESYDHGDDCSGSQDWRTFPSHVNTSYDAAAFVCNNHLMTANAGAGYGAVVLTPNRLIDVSSGPTTVSLRMSTFRHSDRDWVEFSFSPWDGNNVIPCRFCPDLQGNPVQSVMLNMSQEKIDGGETGSGFVLYVNGEQVSGICPCYETVLQPDKARRDLVEIEISDTHLTMTMPEYGLTLVDAGFESLGWDKAIFQIIHHSYDPEKGDAMHGDKAAPNTWHWDDISVSPSIPFEIIKPDRRALIREGPGDLGTLAFSEPAPDDAYLRFAAFANPDVSFDGGATWARAEPQPSTKKQVATETYFMPVPPGTSRVVFRANCVDWYCEEMHVKDAAIWATPGLARSPSTGDPSSEALPPASPISPPATGTAGLWRFTCEAALPAP